MGRSQRRSRPAGPSIMHSVETGIRARYAETDAQGIVYSSHYLVWFEIGRTEWCRQAGINYRQLEEQGYLLVVTDATCRYLAPARYDDEVIVRTWVTSTRSRRVMFAYEVRLKADGKPLATGHTAHLWVDRSGKPILLPPSSRRPFELAAGAVGP